MNQGSLMRGLLILSAFCVNFGAANSEKTYIVPAPVPVSAPVVSPYTYQVPQPVLPPAPVVSAPLPLLPPVHQPLPPVDSWLTFPPVYVPTVTTTTLPSAPPRLQLFCPRRCVIKLNRFGREVCLCPERRNNNNNNNFDLLLALSLFGGHSSGGSTPPVVPPVDDTPYD
jgi:hypothetical protein